jgi:hypothetical protein
MGSQEEEKEGTGKNFKNFIFQLKLSPGPPNPVYYQRVFMLSWITFRPIQPFFSTGICSTSRK